MGTALGAYGLWVLFRPETKATFTHSARLDATERSRILGLLTAMGSVGFAFAVVLGAGFYISSHGMHLTAIHGATGAVLIVVLAFAGMRALRGGFQRRPVSAPRVSTPLPPPPPLCPHLDAVTAAMRDSGIPFRPSGQALCRVNPPALQQPLLYAEFFQPERAAEDNPTAVLRCSVCPGTLEVLHPLLTNIRTPWFPAPPPSLQLIADASLASRLTITAMAAAPDGGRVAIAAGQNQDAPELTLRDVRAKVVLTLPSPGIVRAVAWSPDGRTLAIGTGELWSGGPVREGACVSLWDPATSRLLQRFGDGLYGVRGIVFSPDGLLLATATISGPTRADVSTVDLWHASSGRHLRQVARIDSGSWESRRPYFTCVAFTPDGEYLVAGCDRCILPADQRRKDQGAPPWWWRRGLRAWRTTDYEERNLVDQTAPVRHITCHERLLFTAGDRTTLWDLADGASLWDKPSRSSYPAVLSPDGRYIVRGKGYLEDNHAPWADTCVELCDARTGDLLALGVHSTPVQTLAVAGSTILAGGLKGELRVWSPPF